MRGNYVEWLEKNMDANNAELKHVTSKLKLIREYLDKVPGIDLSDEEGIHLDKARDLIDKLLLDIE